MAIAAVSWHTAAMRNFVTWGACLLVVGCLSAPALAAPRVLVSPPATATAPARSVVAPVEFAQLDNFGQSCALLLQSCYYCCLGCGDLGFNFVAERPAESPIPKPRPRAQAY